MACDLRVSFNGRGEEEEEEEEEEEKRASDSRAKYSAMSDECDVSSVKEAVQEKRRIKWG